MRPLRFRWAAASVMGLAFGLASVVPAAAGQKAAAATTAYAPVALAQASVPRTNFYTAPTSSLTSNGIPFSLGNAYWLRFGDAPARVSMNYAKPVAVHLLLNTSWTDKFFAGQTVGTVRLGFSDGTVRDTALVVGSNIREWEYGVGWTVNTLSGSSTVPVWQGQAQAWAGGAAATVDMLTIPATSTANLTSVMVSDTNASHMGILFQGLTVAYDPWHRPGHSWDTPAATNSQASCHAEAAIFAGACPQGGAADDPKADQ